MPEFQELFQYQQRAEPVHVPVVAADNFDWLPQVGEPYFESPWPTGCGQRVLEPVVWDRPTVPFDWMQPQSQPSSIARYQYQSLFEPLGANIAYNPNLLDWRYDQHDPIAWPLDDPRADLYGDRSFGPVEPPEVTVRRRRGFRTPRRTTRAAARRADNVLADATVNTEIKPPAHWDVTYTNSDSLTFTYDVDLRTLVATVVPGGISHAQLDDLDVGHPHPQYALAGSGITDHGGLTGLSDDDHSIYALNTHVFVVLGAADARLTNERRLTAGTRITLTDNGAGGTLVIDGEESHSTLTNLSADTHTQYALLAGRSGGQSLTGGTGSGDDLTLLSTSHGTKGTIFLGTASAYDQVNDRLGIGDTTPDAPLEVVASQASGPGVLATITITTQDAVTDRGDAAIKSHAILSVSSASDQDIFRGYLSIVQNSMTGGGDIVELRSFNVVMLTDASTTTVDSVGVYIESDVASAGTVTNVRAIWIPTLYGTNKWGIYDQSGGVWETTGGGIVVGAATGGYKGAGTINVAADIYKNNTAFTNPDYVFELAFTGKVEKYENSPGAAGYYFQTLEEVEEFARRHLRLPRIGEEPVGIFGRADRTLEKVEEIFLYLFDLNKRIKALEER